MDLREWLEADGLGGFSSGTVGGVRTRRYHALLCAATQPPVGRMVLVNGCDVFVVLGEKRIALSTQRYQPGVDSPDGATRMVGFSDTPWPTWRFAVAADVEVVAELIGARGAPVTALSWRLAAPRPGISLEVRPFLSGRDFHALHHENGAFGMEPVAATGDRVVWRPYPSVPKVTVVANGVYRHDPAWYRGFLYEEERARGLDHVEDLAAPGVFTFDLSAGPAVWIAAAGDLVLDGKATEILTALRARRGNASAYLVKRRGGKSIIAGYPWFADWGRDTFIAMRGLCLSTGHFDEARDILVEWSSSVSEGMLPNRFPDLGEAPEYNSVDGALWFVVAAYEYLKRAPNVDGEDRGAIHAAIGEIVAGYARGTRMNIRADGDGLLAAGAPGWQLTWMDARVDDVEITPRIGKPVEIQALWINALRIAVELGMPKYGDLCARAQGAFRARFWNEPRGCLYDVVDANHRPGATDPALRPNQIFAVGGLPFALLDGDDARRLVEVVEKHLVTPMGLRSLATFELGYVGRYVGDVAARDRAYHNGTVWPWLMGAFVEAWLRVHPGAGSFHEARRRFYEPLANARVFGHLPEIADGDAPHAPRGCPFQAWSLGELLRLEELLS